MLIQQSSPCAHTPACQQERFLRVDQTGLVCYELLICCICILSKSFSLFTFSLTQSPLPLFSINMYILC